MFSLHRPDAFRQQATAVFAALVLEPSSVDLDAGGSTSGVLRLG